MLRGIWLYSLAIKDRCIRYKKTGSDRRALESAHSLTPVRLAALPPLVARAQAEKRKAPEGAFFVVALLTSGRGKRGIIHDGTVSRRSAGCHAGGNRGRPRVTPVVLGCVIGASAGIGRTADCVARCALSGRCTLTRALGSLARPLGRTLRVLSSSAGIIDATVIAARSMPTPATCWPPVELATSYTIWACAPAAKVTRASTLIN